jgi:2,4-diaminopentanoate dehydrogenase
LSGILYNIVEWPRRAGTRIPLAALKRDNNHCILSKEQIHMTNTTPRTEPYRVVQWATGNIGTRSLRAVIEHPNMALVGLYVHSESKAGRDAGELCGLGPIGIKATRNIDEIVALAADCVLYMQEGCNFDNLCRLLGAGANVVTTRVEFINPLSLDAQVRNRIEDACRQGKSSIHSTGASPGFITEAIPLVLTSLQRRLDSLRIDEFADLSRRDSPEMLFGLMGFGHPPPKSDEGRVYYLRQSFGPALQLVANALSLPLDSVEATGELAMARNTTRIAAGVLERNTVAAQRTTVAGIRGGHRLMSFTATWYCTTDIDVSWDLRPNGWHVVVDGDTPLDVDIRMPTPLERFASVSPGYTAHRAVNAVPFVCAAAPGIRTSVDLPQIIAQLA